MTLEGEPVLSYVLSWPEAAGCPRLTRYYRRAARLWRARWERRLYPLACLELADCRARSRPFRPWNCELSGSAPWETEERASIVLTARETGGSGRSRLVTRGAVWRLRDGTPMPLSSVLPPEYRKQKVLLAALNRAAEECRRGGDILLDGDSGDPSAPAGRSAEFLAGGERRRLPSAPVRRRPRGGGLPRTAHPAAAPRRGVIARCPRWRPLYR